MSRNNFNVGATIWVAVMIFGIALQTANASGPHRELLEAKKNPVTAPGGSFWDTGMRLCALDSSGSCNLSDYALSIARFGLGGGAAGLVALLSFLIFIPVRSICNGFGGKNPSFGICPSSSDDKREYTRVEILSAKVVACVVVIPIIVGIAIGFQSNSDISNSIDSILMSLVDSGDTILSTLQQTRDILVTLPITNASINTINSAVSTATELADRMHDADNIAHQYDDNRESLMIVGFAFSLALVLAGVVCVIFNLRVPAIILGMVGLLVLTLVWLSFGVHLVAGKFVYDVCTDIDVLTANGTDNSNSTSAFKTGALANLWACGPDSEFYALASLVDGAMVSVSNQVCSGRSQICFNITALSGDPNWQCAASPPCGRYTLKTVIDENHMAISDNGVTRSVRECAVNCTNLTYKNYSIAFVTAVDQYDNYTAIYNSTIVPLVTCQFAIDVLESFDEPLCVTLFDALYGVSVSNLVVGIFYVPFIVLMVVGFKRFQSLDGGLV